MKKQKVENVKVKGGKVAVVAEPTKFAKVKLVVKNNKNRIVAIGLTAVVIGGALILYFHNKKDSKTPVKPVIDTNKEEEYSRELLGTRVEDFTKEANNKGIDVTEEEIREFAGFMNIDTIIAEDPELAKELFDGKSAEEIIANAGHMIGKLMTSSFTSDYKNSMNLSTLVVGNDHDKAVLAKLENYRDELTAMRAEGKDEHSVELSTEADEAKFDTVITDVLNFYSMTVDGLEVQNGNAVIQKMGDGNRFATVLVMNEIALGNKNLLTAGQYKAFQELMSNEPVVTNLVTTIEGCQTQKTLTK